MNKGADKNEEKCRFTIRAVSHARYSGGAMNGDKPTWTLVAHVGIIGHDRVLVSLAAPHFINGIIKQGRKYEYLKTGDVLGKCLSFKENTER